jgi:hypothetical protein
VWCECVSLPQGAGGRWGWWEGICVCLGVLERGIGSFEMQLSRSTRDTLAPNRPFRSFSGLSRGSLRPFPLLTHPPAFSSFTKSSPFYSNGRPVLPVMHSPPFQPLRAPWLFLPRRKKERIGGGAALPVNVTPDVAFEIYNQGLRCRILYCPVTWQDRKVSFYHPVLR